MLHYTTTKSTSVFKPVFQVLIEMPTDNAIWLVLNPLTRLSRPTVNIMKKKQTAQKGAKGISAKPSGYATNARPGPGGEMHKHCREQAEESCLITWNTVGHFALLQVEICILYYKAI